MEKHTMTVEGMSCGHCKAAVEKALAGVTGVEQVVVDLESGHAEVLGTGVDVSALENAVVEEGYRVKN